MSWDDIAWVRKFAPNVPVLIKGVGSVDDVVLAKQYGADGVVLSNHGVSPLAIDWISVMIYYSFLSGSPA